MHKRSFWGFSWVVIAMLIGHPVMADIIRTAPMEQRHSADDSTLESQFDHLQAVPSNRLPLNIPEKSYFASAPARLQIVAGLSVEETIGGIFMLAVGIGAGAVVAHQLSK